MMDYTDRHFRYLLRLISQYTFLYSEMVATGVLLYGRKPHETLKFSAQEHPLALQLGGNDPKALQQATAMAAEYGYDEVNLNVGCPSPRVKSGQFGAALMLQPDLVASCLQAMQEVGGIDVSIKTRIGVDHNDDYQQLQVLVEKLDTIGIKTFIIHARKAWLDGLSPKDNREIPPLRYEYVYQLKQDFPHLNIVINGGIRSIAEMGEHLKYVDGVMIGREAYHNCYMMGAADQFFDLPQRPLPGRKQILNSYLDYMDNEMRQGVYFRKMIKHTMGLFYQCPGARFYRRRISELLQQKITDLNCVKAAAQQVDCE